MSGVSPPTPRRGHQFAQHAARHLEQAQQLRVPVAGAEVQQVGPAAEALVGDEAAAEQPNRIQSWTPSSLCVERQIPGWFRRSQAIFTAENTGEILQAGLAVDHAVGGRRSACARSALRVSCHIRAGCSGTPAASTGMTDERCAVTEMQAGSTPAAPAAARQPRSIDDQVPLPGARVLLDAPAVQIDRRVRALVDVQRAPGGIVDDGPHAGGADVDGDDTVHAHPRVCRSAGRARRRPPPINPSRRPRSAR